MKTKLNLLCILFLAFCAVSAQAAVSYWDPLGTTCPLTCLSHLDGTWETASWTTTGTGQATPVAWVEGNAACFAVGTGNGTPAFTVTMNANHNVAGVFD